MKPSFKACGATLVELLIGLSVSGVLLTAMLALMMQQNQQLIRLNDKYAFLSNLRFAIHWLNKDIQRLGLLGCTPINSHNIDNQSLKLTPLHFLQYQMVANSHELTLVTGRQQPDIKLRHKTDPTLPISIQSSKPLSWVTGEVIALTDCEKASLFTISHLDESKGLIFHDIFQSRKNNASLAIKVNLEKALKWVFDPEKLSPMFYQVDQHKYSIKKTNNGVGLYRNDIEIMPDINSFSAQFHLDTNCDGQIDVSSDQPPKNLATLRSIEVKLEHKQTFFNLGNPFVQNFPLPNRCTLQ